MGRIFEKRKVRMFARWAKTAKAFTKLGKEIAIAVKLQGPDPAGNARLRNAINTARSLNMPKDRIEGAIKRASSRDEADLQELTYEAYAPHGVALVIEAATNNPTRTISNVRSIVTHNGGSMASSGALDFVFQRRGVFTIGSVPGDFDEFELAMIDAGLEDIFESDDGVMLYTSFENFGSFQRTLEERKVEIKNASLQRIPTSSIELSGAPLADVEKLISQLEEDDDVQNVFHNLKSEQT